MPGLNERFAGSSDLSKWFYLTTEKLWWQTNVGLGMIEGRVEIDEYSNIQTKRVPNGDVGQIEDIG